MYEFAHSEPHPTHKGVALSECVVIRDFGGLAKGSLAGVREKFSIKAMDAMLTQLTTEIGDGSLYLGSWEKGEIQITKLIGITANRFFIEAEYEVLFPPRKGQSTPNIGTYRNIVWVSGVEAGAGAFPLTKDGDIVLTRSFRHAARRWTIELARGGRLPGEDAKTCAVREMTEETGARPTDASQYVDLGMLDPDTGLLRQEGRLIAITDVVVDSEKVDRDVSESFMQPVVVSAPQFLRMVRTGEITCGWAMGAFTKALAHGLLKMPE
jgi:8-oxo-dGTP pyrophosphatase MutT (NUDIX family)